MTPCTSKSANRRLVVNDGIELANSVGWNVTGSRIDEDCFIIKTGSSNLSLLHADSWHKDTDLDKNHGYLLPAWMIAVRAFASAINCISGHVSVLAPVGCYGSPLQEGAIDSIVFEPNNINIDGVSASWTYSLASISHTRCWVMNLVGSLSSKCDQKSLSYKLKASERITVLSEKLNINDTAALSEYTRDCGRINARFPEIIVLSADIINEDNDTKVIAWLTCTDTVASVSLAELIGSVMNAEIVSSDRFRKLHFSLSQYHKVRL